MTDVAVLLALLALAAMIFNAIAIVWVLHSLFADWRRDRRMDRRPGFLFREWER